MFALIKKHILSLLSLAVIIGFLSTQFINNIWAIVIIIGLSLAFYILLRAYLQKPQTLAVKVQTNPIASINITDFINTSLFPIMVLSKEGSITQLNSSLLQIFTTNTDKSLYLDKHYSTLMRIPQITTLFEQVRTQAGEGQLNFQLPNTPNSHFWLHITPLKNHYCFTFKDLSKDYKIQQMRTDFVANASHELRTPLASISGFIETLQNADTLDKATTAKFLNIMAQQASRMTRLIDDLLSLSKIEINAHTPPQTIVDLHEIASHCINSAQPLATEKNININFDTQISSAKIKGDKDQLIQLISNLLDNAIKYGIDENSDTHKITLRLEHNVQQITLSVIDYGQGISAQNLPRLTERFYRISTAHKTNGTGLGLAIVKHIAQRHNAELNFTSKINKGTKVKLSFNAVTKL